VAVFFRVSGIIYERTTNVGEVLIAHGNNYDHYIKHPASTTYNIGQLAGSLIGTTLDYYSLFICALVICLTANTTSAEVAGKAGSAYYPIMYAGLITNICLFSCLAINYLEMVDVTEDHYYVEGSARYIFVIAMCLLTPLTFIWHGFGIPELITAGSKDFEMFQIEKNLEWYMLFWCSFFGMAAGLLISLLSEYFTSMSCPPS
jgi:Na+/H+-translocating membrane pyrophosphatase